MSFYVTMGYTQADLRVPMQTVAGINALREALMTPESLVAAFLEEKFGKGFCDRCLAARIRSQEGVQVKQAEVRRAATTLAESGHYRRSMSLLQEAVRSAGDGGLGKQVRWGRGGTTAGHLAMRMIFHNGVHCGQLVDLRRALGMEPVIR